MNEDSRKKSVIHLAGLSVIVICHLKPMRISTKKWTDQFIHTTNKHKMALSIKRIKLKDFYEINQESNERINFFFHHLSIILFPSHLHHHTAAYFNDQ